MSTGLESQLKRLRKRVRLLLAERYGLFGAGAGAIVTVVIVLLSSRYDALLSYGLWAGTVLIGAIAGVAYGLLMRLDDLTIALAADKRTGLKERLSTAVALSDSPQQDMEQALVTDAGSRISGIDSRAVFKHKFGLPHAVSGGAMILLMAVIILPQLPVFQSGMRRQEVATMKREGTKLVRLAKDIKNQDTKHPEMAKLAQKLEKLGGKIATGRMGKKQAMLKSQRLGKDIKKEQDRLARENSGTKSMDKAQAEMRKSSENLAKSMADKLAKKENIPPQDALKQLPSDKQLAQLARKDGPLTKSEREQLEQAVAKYTDPNNQQPIPSELGEALAKLAQNKDYQKATQLMQKLAQKMNSGKMSKMDQMMMKAQMKQLAKALKNTDMDKLSKAMLKNAEKLAKMSPQELQKMADEMQRMQRMAKALQKAGAG